MNALKIYDVHLSFLLILFILPSPFISIPHSSTSGSHTPCNKASLPSLARHTPSFFSSFIKFSFSSTKLLSACPFQPSSLSSTTHHQHEVLQRSDHVTSISIRCCCITISCSRKTSSDTCYYLWECLFCWLVKVLYSWRGLPAR